MMVTVICALKRLLYRWRSRLKARESIVKFQPVVPRKDDRTHVYIGAANSAGQATRWARSLENALPGTVAVSVRHQRSSNPFAYPVDQEISHAHAGQSQRWQRLQRKALMKYDAVLIESLMPPYLGYRGLSVVEQIQELQDSGVKCGLVFHGSDIRDPARHMALEPLSYFGVDEAFRRKMEAATVTNRAILSRIQAPVFMSTIGSLREVEGAQWLPVVIDVDSWASHLPPFAHRGPLRVAHAPSSSFIKGTELIEGLLWAMHEKGEIVYKQVTGVPQPEVPAVYRDADVVIDSFRSGNYGTAACESFAAGRLTVAHISEQVRAKTRELTGSDLPIVEAQPAGLRGVLQDIIDRPTFYAEIAAQGVSFVRENHDGRRSGMVLRNWIED